MSSTSKPWKLLPVFALSLSLFPAVTQAQHYKQTNLVSDIAGMAPTVDPNLKNPWGLTRSSTTPARPGSPWGVGNNNSGTSTLYTGAGAILPINGTGTVTVPPPKGSPAGTLSTPTGVVFNGSPSDFFVAPGKSAIFIFATEDGTISGWAGGQNAVPVVDNSDNGSAHGAVYKGATSAEIADGFAPFNVQNIGGTLFVTYAKQDALRHDPVGGDGFGFVELFSPNGNHVGHLQHGPWMNAPWGVVWTTRDFGEFSNAILVGNFRSGWIAAFNGFTHKFIGWVTNPDDSLVTIDGLWSLTFGNDATAGPANTLFFTAGINNEQDGLFGTLTPVNGLDGDEE